MSSPQEHQRDRVRIVADAHVHIYPLFDLSDQLANASRNLPPADARLLCLAERAGQCEFRALRDGARAIPGWTIEHTSEEDSVCANSEFGALYIIAGRQIVTAEKIEVLALGRDVGITDGESLAETLARVRAGDAVAVLPWGLGKWWGRRGRLVQAQILRSAPDAFAVADTYLLPAKFPEPALLRRARARGFAVVHGTDPLPRPGDEQITGRWATAWELERWDASRPATELKRVLRERIKGTPAGRRGSLWETLRRMV